MTIRIVTDSNSDLPADLIERYGIVVIPSLLTFGGRSYLDGVDIQRADYYQRLPNLKPLPTTAAPASGVFEEAFRSCGDADIVAVLLAEKLSAMCNAARLGAEPFGDRVRVVDSGQVSLAMGFQVLAAAEAAKAGQPMEAVLARIRSVQQRIKLYAVLDTAEYLRRGGRANAFTATLGDLLQIKPLIEVDQGEVHALAKLRTRGKARENLIERVVALGPLERLAVVHVACPDGAEEVAQRLGHRSALPPLIAEATAVIGTHAGPGTVGVGALCAA